MLARVAGVLGPAGITGGPAQKGRSTCRDLVAYFIESGSVGSVYVKAGRNNEHRAARLSVEEESRKSEYKQAFACCLDNGVAVHRRRYVHFFAEGQAGSGESGRDSR